MRRLLVLLGAFGALAGAPPAVGAGPPVLPLSQVEPGLRCTARSVIHGTTISSFAAEVLEVVDGRPLVEGARILMRFSGPAVDVTGLGPGFSGSPVYCPGSDGAPRVAGAISEGIADYGNKLALVTPIEQVLGQPVRPPRGIRLRPAILARARPLAALTITGLPRPLRATLRAAARRAGRTVLSSAGGSASRRFAPNPLLPGAAMAVGLADGDLSAGAIGTVTYRDGPRLWAFGHPLDAAGRRSLFLQDAYVYGVVNNPLGGDVSTYKLAAPGHDLGTLSGDGPNAVAGRLGPLPPATALKVRVRDRDTGRRLSAASRVADEADVGNPTGYSSLSLLAPLGAAAMVTSAFGGSPAAESGRACVALSVRGIRRALRFCNRYVVTGPVGIDEPAPLAGLIAADVGQAVALVDAVSFASLRVEGLVVSASVARGRHEAIMRSVAMPREVRPGQRVAVRLRAQRYRGRFVTFRFPLRIPRSLEPGRRLLVLAGPASDTGGLEDLVVQLLGGGLDESGLGELAPREAGTRAELAAAVRRLGRYDGVSAVFPSLDRMSGGSGRMRPALRDPGERISGALKIHLRVLER